MAVVLITGCSSGIGLDTALAFARNGHTVVASMRDVSKSKELETAATAEGLSIEIEQLDVRDDASVSAAVAAVMGRHGGVDVLVNNAGVSPLAAFEFMSQDDIDMIWDTNVFGPMRLIKALVPSMRKRGSGAILNVSSVAGRVPAPSSSIYSSSKAALSTFSEALAQELHPFGIRVAAIEPGMYATPNLGKTIASLPDDGNPYADAERRMRLIIQQGSSEAEDPADVAAVLVATAEADVLPGFRILVGEGGKMFANGRANASDQDILEMVAAQTDEDYFAHFANIYGSSA